MFSAAFLQFMPRVGVNGGAAEVAAGSSFGLMFLGAFLASIVSVADEMPGFMP
jgi:hypothetical protein